MEWMPSFKRELYLSTFLCSFLFNLKTVISSTGRNDGIATRLF